MTERDQLIAYLATLTALVVVILGALIVAACKADVMGKMEVFGLGTVTGGLIGVLRMPSRPSQTVSSADTVNQNGGGNA